MSFSEYKSVLPDLYSGQDPAAEKGVLAHAGKPTKQAIDGFADIIEYHKEGLSGREIEVFPTSRFLQTRKRDSKKTSQYSNYAMLLRRTWMQYGATSVLVRLELEIQSEALSKAIRKIVTNFYEGTDLQSFPINIKTPFMELFFYRNKIKALTEDEQEDADLRVHAKALHNFITENGLMSSIIRDHERYSKEGRVVCDILWTIYPPNSLLVVDSGVFQECWICRNILVQQTLEGIFWEITGLRIGFDGTSPGLARKSFTLPHTGMQVCNISDLPLVPIECYRDQKGLKDILSARASTLRRVIGENMSSFLPQVYDGPTWANDFDKLFTQSNPMIFAKQINERVIVDFKSYITRYSFAAPRIEDLGKKFKKPTSTVKPRGMLFTSNITRPKRRPRRANPNYSESESDSELSDSTSQSDSKDGEFNPEEIEDIMSFKDPESIPENETSTSSSKSRDLIGLYKAAAASFNISEEDYELLFPALVPAFTLTGKDWRWVISDKLCDVRWNSVAFESLQLEGMTKKLVEALVKGHKTKSSTFDDVMPGKGQGLIFLLHGKPGLGKTLTAESVADYLERPLYSISGGELSTDVTLVEQKLAEIFELTKRWNAVSLLDEADVLLCKRSSAEMDRNAIVAVFLRKIEYFQGVLFLTTNRKKDFDEAFKSRIHVTISYPELSNESQSIIWKKLIAANKAVRMDASWTEEVYTALGNLNFNGRMIKNLLRTAVAYADAEEEFLGARHVLAIVQTELKDDDDFEGEQRTPGELEKRKQAMQAVEDLQILLGAA